MIVFYIVGAAVYAAAALDDLGTRSAGNGYWAALFLIGLLQLAVVQPSVGTMFGLAIVTTTVGAVAIDCWRRGLIGGADAKAVVVLPIVFPRSPGSDLRRSVLGTLLQGFEVAMVVSAVAGFVGLGIIAAANRRDVDLDGVPFLVPIFCGVVALAVA